MKLDLFALPIFDTELFVEDQVIQCGNWTVMEYGLVHESVCSVAYQDVAIEELTQFRLLCTFRFLKTWCLLKDFCLTSVDLKVKITVYWRDCGA